MKNAGNGQVSRVLFGLFLGLLLAGPVFGNEGLPVAPADGSVVAPKVEEKKVESKGEKKGKRRHHKNKKAEAKVEAAPSAASPEAKLEEASPEAK